MDASNEDGDSRCGGRSGASERGVPKLELWNEDELRVVGDARDWLNQMSDPESRLKKRAFRLTIGITYALCGLTLIFTGNMFVLTILKVAWTVPGNAVSDSLNELLNLVALSSLGPLIGCAILSVGVYFIWTRNRFSKLQQDELTHSNPD